MRILRVTNDSEITRLSAAVTCVALAVVTLLMVLLYPRDQWLREMMVGWPTTTLLAYGATRVVGAQMLKVHALNEELQRLVSRDRLTNVATRDFFFASLMERPQRHGVTLMIDIDHFKQVNDTHGHMTGDKVIAHVARRMAGSVGARDIVCRFGGEEFVIFLENATQGIAREVAERIRQRVAEAPVESDGVSVRVTVSIGGSLRLPASRIEDAVCQADCALYRAKELGRNRTVMVGETAATDDVQRDGGRSVA